MSLLLSISFIPAYWSVVSSMILCMISSKRAASNLTIYVISLYTLSGEGGKGAGRGGISNKTVVLPF